MKTPNSFLRTTIAGGILFMIPLVLLIAVINKAHELLLIFSAPLADMLPSIIFGLDGSNLLAIFLLVVICFISGMLFRLSRVKKGVNKLEENVLSYLPGYVLLKSIAADALGERVGHDLDPVFIKDGDHYNFAFLVEESDFFCTVFIPDAPRHDAGEVRIVPTDSIKKIDASITQTTKSLSNYGKGALHWLKAEK